MPPIRPRFRTSRIFDLILVLLLATGLWQAAVHRIGLADQAFFFTHKPSPEVVALASRVNFTPEGRRLFYRGNPQIITDKTERDRLCGGEDFGCLTKSGQIVIYDPSDDLSNEVVSAAHETLHLAYRRYSENTRAQVDDLITRGLTEYSSSRTLQSELDGYSGSDRLDEAHSYLGSEYAPLPLDLELHYAKYFANRAQIVTAYRADQS